MVISIGPKAWADPPNFFEQKIGGNTSLIPVFVEEVERMYAEEGFDLPSRR